MQTGKFPGTNLFSTPSFAHTHSADTPSGGRMGGSSGPETPCFPPSHAPCWTTLRGPTTLRMHSRGVKDVHSIRSLRNGGESYVAIVDQLNADGTSPRSGESGSPGRFTWLSIGRRRRRNLNGMLAMNPSPPSALPDSAILAEHCRPPVPLSLVRSLNEPEGGCPVPLRPAIAESPAPPRAIRKSPSPARDA